MPFFYFMKNIILISIFFLLTPFIAKAAVVINEIAWMGTENLANDEWIELYGDQQVDLTGWILEAVDGTPIINLEGTISADGYFLLERTDDNSVPGVVANQIYTGVLGNSGEYLKLKDSSANVVDEVNCSEEWFAGDNSTKQTMERTISGWQTSLNPGGTPKAQNSSGETAEESQEEETQPASTPTNTGTTAGAANQPPIADAGNDIIAFIGEEITFDGSKSYDPDGSELAYEWNLGEGGVKDEAVATHHYSYPGTYLVTLMVYDGFYYSNDTITVEVYPKKITINEFLPSPVGKDAGDEEDPGEWIELYNDSDQIINISGWQLDDEDGGSKPFIFPENTLIAPKGFLVFSRQTTGIALNNDNDKVRLLLSTGIVFQEVSYEKAKEGTSSALTPQGFVWSTPTPGLPNIVISGEQAPEYEGSLQSETTSQSSENVVLNWTHSTQPEDIVEKDLADQRQYNLADLEESSGGNNKIVLIILTIAVIIFAVVIGVLKRKKIA